MEAEEKAEEGARILAGLRYFNSSSATAEHRAQMVLGGVGVRVATSFESFMPGLALPDSSAQEAPTVEFGGKLEADLQLLDELGWETEVARFSGGHEWTDEFRSRCQVFLDSLASEG